MPQRGILRFKSALGLEWRGNHVQEEEYQRDHRRQRKAILSPDQYGRGFRHTQAAIDPVASMQAIVNPRLKQAAEQVRAKLKKVIDEL